MFVPKIPLVAYFGEEKDSIHWITKPVIAIDDDGEPWVVSNARALVLAKTFSNYRMLSIEGDDAHRVEILPAHEGWRAVFATECEDGKTTAIDINILPVAAWKRNGDALIPLVPHDLSYGLDPASANWVRGRNRIEDAQDDCDLLIAVYGPGEDIPSHEHFVKVAEEDFAKRKEFRECEAARVKTLAQKVKEKADSPLS